ncbi:MAG: glutamate--tRNA ligase family protein [Candidatus Paceibacterota bacterium]|jgi:glutamyl-tRNA synthetase
MDKKIITRFAPSPTGHFHVGGIRGALYNFIFAKQNQGVYVLRSEDTDKERSKKEYENEFLEVFEWLGLKHDQFFRQSDRLEIHQKYLKKMIEDGFAYVSKETPKEVGQRDEVIRFKNPNKKITFQDLILGEITVDTTDLGDFIIARDINEPLYHLTVVIDDFEMGITHVIRGQEHTPNTPRQILIQEAIGATRPIYAHLPLILNSERAKLSKRDPSVMPAIEYKNEGYLPEAVLNFMAFNGWNPGGENEIFTLKELIEKFDIKKVQKGGAVFNPEKLDWLNKEHIKKFAEKNPEELKNKIFEYLPKELQIDKLIPLILERISKFGDIKNMLEAGELDFFFKQPEYAKEKLIYKNSSKEKIEENIEKAISVLKDIEEKDFNIAQIKLNLMKLADSLDNRGELLHPVRFALSGLDKSPDPFIIAEILGKNETLSRLQKAL